MTRLVRTSVLPIGSKQGSTRASGKTQASSGNRAPIPEGQRCGSQNRLDLTVPLPKQVGERFPSWQGAKPEYKRTIRATGSHKPHKWAFRPKPSPSPRGPSSRGQRPKKAQNLALPGNFGLETAPIQTRLEPKLSCGATPERGRAGERKERKPMNFPPEAVQPEGEVAGNQT